MTELTQGACKNDKDILEFQRVFLLGGISWKDESKDERDCPGKRR